MVNTIETAKLESAIRSMNFTRLAEHVYQVDTPEGKTVLEVLNVDINLKTMTVRHNHTVYDFTFKNELDLVLDKMGIKRSVDNVASEIKAPMPGKVIDVLIAEGTAVQKGDGILILEAMKMENVLKAEHDCTIKKVMVSTGESVEKNQILIDLV